jgi:hypothetical protein
VVRLETASKTRGVSGHAILPSFLPSFLIAFLATASLMALAWAAPSVRRDASYRSVAEPASRANPPTVHLSDPACPDEDCNCAPGTLSAVTPWPSSISSGTPPNGSWGGKKGCCLGEAPCNEDRRCSWDLGSYLFYVTYTGSGTPVSATVLVQDCERILYQKISERQVQGAVRV